MEDDTGRGRGPGKSIPEGRAVRKGCSRLETRPLGVLAVSTEAEGGKMDRKEKEGRLSHKGRDGGQTEAQREGQSRGQRGRGGRPQEGVTALAWGEDA